VPEYDSFSENDIGFCHSARDLTDHRYNKLASLSAGGQKKDRVLVPQNWKPQN